MATYSRRCFMNGVVVGGEVPGGQDSWTPEQSQLWDDFVNAGDALYNAFIPERVKRTGKGF
jgi:hypothetical protein